MIKLKNIFAVILPILLLSGCDDGSTESSSSMNIFIAADQTAFTAGEAVEVTVTAENPTTLPIEFGSGSSNCQLSAVIRIDNQDHSMPSSRPCLADYVVQSLGPGEHRVESWIWYGEILVEGELEHLPTGSYEIRGVAGAYKSHPLNVEILD